MKLKPFVIQKAPVLKFKGEKWLDGKIVKYPVSYTYNGGIIIGDKLYSGFQVPEPIIPKGYKLVSGLGFGLQLNARPPYASRLMVKI